jgi:hypothetical protein
MKKNFILVLVILAAVILMTFACGQAMLVPGGTTTTTTTTTTIAPAPNIVITDDQGAELISGGSFSWPRSLLASTSGHVTLTIQNNGNLGLTLTGSPLVDLSGDSVITVKTQPGAAALDPDGSMTFVLEFSPLVAGSYSTILSISSNDPDLALFTCTVNAKGISPEIHVTDDASVDIASSGTYTGFGTIQELFSKKVTFRIHNFGDATLDLTGTPVVSISGDSDFSIDTQATGPVLPGGDATFIIDFVPSSDATFSAVITIANSDLDESSYSFTITGTGSPTPVPDINLKQSTTNIASGSGSYNFGNVLHGTNSDAQFTIENTGTAVLNLSGTPKVALTGDSEFSVTAQPGSTVAIGSSVTFTVRFAPATPGTYSANLSIANDDPDEAPYTITLNGTGAQAEMNIKQGSTSIASGSGSFDFGNINYGTSGSAIVFTVENSGNGPLYLSGTPKVTKSGTNASLFTIDQSSLSGTISPAGSSTFTIMFSPNTTGDKTATISIANSDLNENPYTFTITGTGAEPEINVKQGSTSLPDWTGVYDFGVVQKGSSSSPVTFTIENSGNGTLNLTGTPRVVKSGTDASLFSISQASLPGTIASSGSATFIIVFNPDTKGVKTATISIASNDSDENPYTFTVTGTGKPLSGFTEFRVIGNIPELGSIPFEGSTPEPADYANAPVMTLVDDYIWTCTVSISSSASGWYNPASAVGAVYSCRNASGSILPHEALFATDPLPVAYTGVQAEFPTGDVTFTYYENLRKIITTKVGVSAPAIAVLRNQKYIVYAGITTAGSVPALSSGPPVTITIKNMGTTDLQLTGTPKIILGDIDSSCFSVNTSSLAGTILAGGTSSFTVTFSPDSTGSKHASMTIPCNDPNFSSFRINIYGNGTDTYYSSFTYVNSPIGDCTLVADYTWVANYTNLSNWDSRYRIFINDTYWGGGISSGISLPQEVTGLVEDGVYIDAYLPKGDLLFTYYESENRMVLEKAPAPDINFKQGSEHLPDGIGMYVFPGRTTGTSSSPVVFTVENLGNLDLNLTGSPKVTISGDNSVDFVIDQSSLAATISASGSSTFSVVFNPSTDGTKYADVTIANDDVDESMYTFTLSGTAQSVAAPEISMKQGATPVMSGGTYDFGTIQVGVTDPARTFTIYNAGLSDLTLSGAPKVSISGANASEFEIIQSSLAATIASAGSSSFTIQFTPSSAGIKTAEISISNDDSDENPFTFTIQGLYQYNSLYETISIPGSAAELAVWIPATAPHMTLIDHYTWQAVVTFSTTETIQFKLAANEDWGVNWGLGISSGLNTPQEVTDMANNGGNIELNVVPGNFRFTFYESEKRLTVVQE